ncbi:apicoplast TIC22 protein [Hepatocystis sp. ex Piliocolobus tephrosceles]|nr:apicoplast TIC22 protein [Hepatocystis sp. ex Piliocolobus tephrosceles]
MYLFFLFYIYLIIVINCVNLNKCLKEQSINVVKPNVSTLKKQLRRNKFCMFGNKINLCFWKKKYHRRSIDEKLSVIPVYIITNHNNSPYIFNEDDKEVCYMFLCPYDAEDMLNKIIINNGITNKNNIKLHAINMQKAYELIKEFLFLKKLEHKNENVKKNIIYWKLISSTKQYQNALMYLSYKKKSEVTCPIFYIDNLFIRKDSKNITPMFFDIEDLKECTKKVNMTNKQIKVLNFIDLVLSDKHMNFGFIPSSRSLEYLKKLSKIGIRKSYF